MTLTLARARTCLQNHNLLLRSKTKARSVNFKAQRVSMLIARHPTCQRNSLVWRHRQDLAFPHFQCAQIWRGCLSTRAIGRCPTGATLHSQGQQTSFVHPLLQLLDCHRGRPEEGEPFLAVPFAAASRGAARVLGSGKPGARGRCGPGAASAPAVHPASTWRRLVRLPARTAPDPAVARPPLEGRRFGTHLEAVETSAAGQPHPRSPWAASPRLPRRRPGRGHLLPRAAAASALPVSGAGSAVRRAAGGRRLARSPGSRRATAICPAPVAPPRAGVRGQVVHGLDQQIIGLSQLGLQPACLQAAALRPRGGAHG